MSYEKVNVLFNENYTVRNDDGDFYKEGEVYEMTPAQAALFTYWCDSQVTDRTPTAKPVRTGKRPRFSLRPRPVPGTKPLTPESQKWLLAVMGPPDTHIMTQNG
jgi:hypothetical protein